MKSQSNYYPTYTDLYHRFVNKIKIIFRYKLNRERVNKIGEWHNDGGVLIMGYDMYRNLSSDSGKLKKREKESIQAYLVDPGPDLVVCDEGHLLKNSKTSLSKAVNRIRTLRRIVLTGTPLQNNLNECKFLYEQISLWQSFWIFFLFFLFQTIAWWVGRSHKVEINQLWNSANISDGISIHPNDDLTFLVSFQVQFVKPNLLGKYNEYLNRFVNPITNGQYEDSTPRDIQMMKKRSHILHKLLDGCVQRRDYSVLAPYLPVKHEYVVSIQLTPLQVKLYEVRCVVYTKSMHSVEL